MGEVEEAGGRSAMNAIKERLERDLAVTVGRLRQTDRAVAVEEPEFVTTAEDDGGDATADGVRREIDFATRELLVERINCLAAALDRLSCGEYGTCMECGERISPARLNAIPEAQTCVRCQDALERSQREQTGRRS